MVSIALIGLGGAGLAFMHQLLNSPLKKWTITIIDPNPESAFSKTWCFWGKPDELSTVKHDMLWDTINVQHNDVLLNRPLKNLNYRCVKGRSFQEQVWAEMSGHPNVNCIQDTAADINYDTTADKVNISTTNHGIIIADYCFSSAKIDRSDTWKPDFYQQFAGGWVRFDKPIFDSNEIMLMDFDVPQVESAVHFAYTLPNSSSDALIEITAFTPTLYSSEHYNTMFLDYLNRLAKNHNTSYTIYDTEEGLIPMDTRPYKRQLNPKTFTLGTVSGMVKPSTGYAFFKMHKQAEFYLSQILSGGSLAAYPETHPRFKFYDDLLLDILKNDPHIAIPIFHQLFNRVHPDTVFEFLRENTSLQAEAGIFMKLPKSPFLKALWRYVFK
ncbi:MAG: hypothetical protein JJU41_00440 [Bacteroidetes bacterium]|nr:hypothetical protein [Bacteroidota bacterium]